MVTVLVVDDCAVDRALAGGLVKHTIGATVTYAVDGQAAAAALAERQPDLVLTDLQMPNMNGLELVEHIRRNHPLVPVILMTGHGSEEIAAEALKAGAASYVPKVTLAQDLKETLESVLSMADAGRDRQQAAETAPQMESQFILGNDPEAIPEVVGRLEQGLTMMGLCDETGRIRVAMALREALLNAMEHGNLEAPSALREGDGQAYQDLLQTRRQCRPYCDRRVHLSVKESREQAIYVIRDEGPGFDPASLPDPTDPANLERVSGRGLLLIRTFMDEVKHGAGGRQITMTKRREQRSGGAES